jgi:beta-N-acetylhexosaminidase
MRTRAIYGCLGPELTPDERRFFDDSRPWGFIVFSRNIVDRNQLRALIGSLRECVQDENAPVLIAQEGGRVAPL